MKLIKYLVFSTLCMSFAACSGEDFFTPLVDIQLPAHKSKLVVFASFTGADDSLVVHLTRSKSALDTSQTRIITTRDSFLQPNGTYYYYYGYLEYDTLQSAKVELYRNEQLWGTFKFRPLDGKYFLRQKLPVDGATYKLKVAVSGYETVEAIQKMPAMAALDSVRIVKQGAVVQDVFDTRRVDEITYFMQDPVETGNYYVNSAEFVDNQNRYSQYYRFTSLDPLANNDVLNDKSFNGKSYKWRLYADYLPTGQKKDKFIFSLYNTTIDAFLFQRSRDLNENAQDNPFAEPVILYSNITNGYGIFALSSVARFTKQY